MLSPPHEAMATTRVETSQPQFARFSRPALIVGAVALVAAAVGAFISSAAQFWQSYLFAFALFLVLGMGGLGLLMLQYVTGGRWGQTIKRILEAMALTLFLMAALFVPILVSLFTNPGAIYPWTNPSIVAANEILNFRVESGYLTPLWFIVRAVLFFTIWLGLTSLLTRWSSEQDRAPSEALQRRFGRLSAIGIVLFMLTYSFAMIDWGMTTEKVWYSTMYPVLFVVASAVTGVAFSAFVLSFIYREPLLNKIANANRFHDLGSLMFAFVVFWTYINFSQFLIMYSANIAEEAEFYVQRTQGGWQFLGYMVTACCFVLPFFTLLVRRNKKHPNTMRYVGAFILFAQLLNIFYTLVPTFHPEQFSISWIDIVAVLGIGGLWIGTFLYILGSRPLVAVNDPRQEACLETHHGDGFETDSARAHA